MMRFKIRQHLPLQADGPSERIKITLPANITAEQIVLVAKIRAQEERLYQRGSWSHNEIKVLLQGAADAAILGNNVKMGSELLHDANAVFLQTLQTANRNYYLAALIAGILVVAGIAWFVIYLANDKFGNLAEQSILISLFAFAGMGSITSALIGLPNLDLKNELSRKFVIYLAIAKPLIAISFASVVYVILKNNLVTIASNFDGDNGGKEAFLWVAAFLCGFSERFAVGILNQVSPNSASHDAAQKAPTGKAG
jgi:hypothetical protein